MHSIPKINGFYYLASPYSKYAMGLDQAAIDVSKIAGKFLKEGHAIYSPIAHSHTIAEHAGLDKLDYELWLPMNDAAIAAAEGLIVAKLEGWAASYGTKIEIAAFIEAKKPIYLYDPYLGLVER